MKTSFGELQLDVAILAPLRAMAEDGKHASEMAEFVIEQLGGTERLVMAIAYFQIALEIGLGNAKALGAWHRFPGSTWTDQQLNDDLDPVIQARVAARRAPG